MPQSIYLFQAQHCRPAHSLLQGNPALPNVPGLMRSCLLQPCLQGEEQAPPGGNLWQAGHWWPCMKSERPVKVLSWNTGWWCSQFTLGEARIKTKEENWVSSWGAERWEREQRTQKKQGEAETGSHYAPLCSHFVRFSLPFPIPDPMLSLLPWAPSWLRRHLFSTNQTPEP